MRAFLVGFVLMFGLSVLAARFLVHDSWERAVVIWLPVSLGASAAVAVGRRWMRQQPNKK